MSRIPTIAGRPLLKPDTDLPKFTDWAITHYSGEFCVAADFDPAFVAALWYEGYLTIASRYTGQVLLLPKLHVQRCVLYFSDLRLHRSAKKKAKHFHLSVDMCFDDVVNGCIRQHGQNWLYPPMVKTLKHIHQSPSARGVRVHSFEIWEEEDLVGGELGYSVGACYTSLTGFCTVDSAGTVQCLATARVLENLGYAMWDLGMGMAYKYAFGARLVPRQRFISELRALRDNPNRLVLERTPCADLLQSSGSAPSTTGGSHPAAPGPAAARPPTGPGPGPGPGVTTDPSAVTPISKNQLKKQAKLQKREMHKAQKRQQREGQGSAASATPMDVTSNGHPMGDQEQLEEGEVVMGCSAD